MDIDLQKHTTVEITIKMTPVEASLLYEELHRVNGVFPTPQPRIAELTHILGIHGYEDPF